MPKRVAKITKFEGGMNTGASPQDVLDNEAVEITNGDIDVVGSISTLGAFKAHDAATVPSSHGGGNITINPGYGLFPFSHDRAGAEAINVVDSPFDISAGKWSESASSDWATSANVATFTRSDNADHDLINAAADRPVAGTGGVQYTFKFKVTAVTSPGNFTKFRILGGTGQFAAGNVDLPGIDGSWSSSTIYYVSFTSHADAASNPFTIRAAGSAACNISITEPHLYRSSNDETGDSYLALADVSSTDADIYVYSKNNGWSTKAVTNLASTATSNAQISYYYADGALRISDGNFGAANKTKWYGYIERRFFGDGVNGYDVGSTFSKGYNQSRWQATDAELTALPVKSAHANGIPSGMPSNYTIPTYGTLPDVNNPISIEIETLHDIGEGNGALMGEQFSDLRDWNGAGGSGGTYSVCTGEEHVLLVRCKLTGSHIVFDQTGTGSNGTGPMIGIDRFCSAGDHIMIKGFDSDTDGGGDRDYTWNCTRIVKEVEGGIHGETSWNPNKIKFTTDIEGPPSDDAIEGYLYNLSRSNWYDSNNKNLEIAVSTLYDDSKQESPLYVTDANLSPDNIVCAYGGYTSLRLHCFVWAHPTNGLHLTYPRVSGFKVYMRRENTPDWYLQWEIDISRGVIGNLSENAGDDNDTSDAQSLPGKGWQDDELNTHANCAHCKSEIQYSLKLGSTYETETGYPQDISSIGFEGFSAGFKTAVLANRTVYAGNVNIKDKNGVLTKKGDSMLKSQINKFDTFIYDRVIDVSVNDGDEIIHLEEYADRILQFKKRKLHIINVSQDIEFLEDTFIHKGVKNSAQVCKTDFGIAWVNHSGVYLYDGERVVNLFEKANRKLISKEEWEEFTIALSTTPMIGYIPNKRQLLISQHNASGHNGHIYIYNLVHQSWSKGGDDSVIDSTQLTNFSNDWDGNLIYAYNTSLLEWDPTPLATASPTFTYITKDIDFGNPAVRKKVYKVYVTYNGGTYTGQQNTTKIVCTRDTSNDLDGKYMDIYFRQDSTASGVVGKTLIWFDTNSSGSAPSGTGGIGAYDDEIKVDLETDDTAEMVAAAIANAINHHNNGDGNEVAIATVNGDVVTVTDSLEETRTAATNGNTSFTVTTPYAGTSSSSTTNVDVEYSVNGANVFNAMSADLNSSSPNQNIAECIPNNLATANNIYTFQLKFNGTVSRTFKINDISIVYREKNVK